MLPIVDKPLIQYAVEEAMEAGITQLIFVTSSNKRAIEDHFDSNYELEAKLTELARHDLLSIVQHIIPPGVSCAYIRQTQALGLGHAVLCAKNLIGNEAFAVLLADDFMENGAKNCLKDMLLQHANQTQPTSFIAVEAVPLEDSKKYGIVAVDTPTDQMGRIHKIVEKPAPEDAPSNLAVVGRYVLTPRIFHMLTKTAMDTRGEVQLTDAIAGLLQEEPVYSYPLQGRRYDCGSKLGYLQATVQTALKHPQLGKAFAAYLSTL
jgi:UTP--glucose-1-phosphate uridylyltransferase